MTTSDISSFLYPHPTCIFVEGAVHLPSGFFMRNVMLDLHEVEEFRRKHNNTDVYTTVYQYDNKENHREGNKYGAIYLDFDCKVESDGSISIVEFEKTRQDAITGASYFKSIFGIPENACHYYFSGSKGFHLTISPSVFQLQPHKQLHRIFKPIIQKIPVQHNTVDVRIYDAVRMWRMPNSINSKSGLYKIPLTFQELSSISFYNLLQLARSPRLLPALNTSTNSRAKRGMDKIVRDFTEKLDKKATTSKAKRRAMDVVPPCVSILLNTTTQQGQRNNTAMALAGVLWQQGHTEDEAFVSLESWSEEHCSPPLDEEELRRTIRSQYSGEYTYGCTAMKDLSACDSSQCPFKKKRTGIR